MEQNSDLSLKKKVYFVPFRDPLLTPEMPSPVLNGKFPTKQKTQSKILVIMNSL
jgi:hypothetical protein